MGIAAAEQHNTAASVSGSVSLSLPWSETIRLIRDRRVREVGKREIIYLSLHCHHRNDSCIKMGSDESHFNVSP